MFGKYYNSVKELRVLCVTRKWSFQEEKQYILKLFLYIRQPLTTNSFANKKIMKSELFANNNNLSNFG